MVDALNYFAFGDSITSGNNVHHSERYPTILAAHLEQRIRHPVHIHNLGKSGLTSSKLLRLIQAKGIFGAVHRAQLVTVCIGGDDLIYGYIKWRIFRQKSYLQKSMKKLHMNYDYICQILSTAAPRRVVMSTFYNPFPQTSLAIESVRYCNEQILYPVAEKYGLPVANIYNAFKGREHLLLAHYRSGRLEDYLPFSPNSPIHPNADGYQIIANCFAEKVL